MGGYLLAYCILKGTAPASRATRSATPPRGTGPSGVRCTPSGWLRCRTRPCRLPDVDGTNAILGVVPGVILVADVQVFPPLSIFARVQSGGAGGSDGKRNESCCRDEAFYGREPLLGPLHELLRDGAVRGHLFLAADAC